MFLSKLYSYNKGLFIAFVLFIVSFLYLNIKWGVVAGPVFQYGMFSGVHKKDDPQIIYTLVADGKAVNMALLSFEKRDVILQQLELYSEYRSVNDAVNNVMRFTKHFLSSEAWKQIYQPSFSDKIFSEWLKSKVAQVSGSSCTSLHVYKQAFQFDGNTLKPVSAQEKILFIAP